MNKDGGPKYRCVVIIASQKMPPRCSNLRRGTAYAYWDLGREKEEEQKTRRTYAELIQFIRKLDKEV